jgi:Fur family iron response transcriptional regulator
MKFRPHKFVGALRRPWQCHYHRLFRVGNSSARTSVPALPGQSAPIDRFAVTEYMSGTIRRRRTYRIDGPEGVQAKFGGLMVPNCKDGVSVDQRVREAGLRPTRQRVALADLLFAQGDRHLSAEELHEEALAAGVPVSLATVYNALHQFTEAGLLRILAVEGSKTYFDTNTSDHHHFYIEGENKIFDIDSGPVEVRNLPEPPEGMEICNVDIVVRLRPKRNV